MLFNNKNDFRLKLSKTGRHFNRIVLANDISMSVQAGEGLYSSPRANVPVGEYTAWEVAFIDSEGHFVQPFCTEGILEHWGHDQVLAYASTAEVQSLYERGLNPPPQSDEYPKVLTFEDLWGSDEDSEDDNEANGYYSSESNNGVYVIVNE